MPTVDELSPANQGPVRYFLVNARTGRGELAKRVKAELKEML